MNPPGKMNLFHVVSPPFSGMCDSEGSLLYPWGGACCHLPAPGEAPQQAPIFRELPYPDSQLHLLSIANGRLWAGRLCWTHNLDQLLC